MEKLTKEMILERINSSISKELLIERINSSIYSSLSKEDIISIINSIESKSDWYYCHDDLLSKMTHEEFIQVLDKKGYTYEIDGNKIIVTHEGRVDLQYLTSLPSDVVFRNGGSVKLMRLVSFPTGVEFKNVGGVWLESLTSIPSDVVFRNEGGVHFRRLNYRILESVEFRNEGVIEFIDMYNTSSILFRKYNNGYNLFVHENYLDDFCTLETTVSYFRNKREDFKPEVSDHWGEEITRSVRKILNKYAKDNNV